MAGRAEQGEEGGLVGAQKISLVQIREDRATLTNGNSGILVHDTVFQKLRGKLDLESVRAAPTSLGGFATFVLPVFFAEKSKVNSPDRNNLV